MFTLCNVLQETLQHIQSAGLAQHEVNAAPSVLVSHIRPFQCTWVTGFDEMMAPLALPVLNKGAGTTGAGTEASLTHRM